MKQNSKNNLEVETIGVPIITTPFIPKRRSERNCGLRSGICATEKAGNTSAFGNEAHKSSDYTFTVYFISPTLPRSEK